MTGEEFQSKVAAYIGETPEWIETGREQCWGHSHSVGYYKLSDEAKARVKKLADELELGPNLICRYALGKSCPAHSGFMEIIAKGIEVLTT